MNKKTNLLSIKVNNEGRGPTHTQELQINILKLARANREHRGESRIKPAFKELRELLVPASQRTQSGSIDSRSRSNEDMKELGRPGSNVFIPYNDYSLAESAQTPTAMATSLLRAVFPEKILLISNYKGRAPKNSKDTSIRHKALDKTKIAAIRETVKQRFGKDFKEGDFGRAINVKCNKLRQLDREAKAKQQGTSNERSP